MTNPIYPIFQNVLKTHQQSWVAPYEAPRADTAHQFVLFIKPEATADHLGVDVEAVLNVVMERMTAFETTAHAIRILPAAYLGTHSIMAQHYGVINRISRLGREALTEAAQEKLQECFAEDLAKGAKVLGGEQFISEQPDISPLALSTMNDNMGTTKLGGGSYVMKLQLFGQVYLILNPFHAYQLVPFTTGDRAIIVMECRSNQDWSVLRADLTGTTNPATAVDGSIRAEFLARKDELGLPEVNQGSNGIHLSAGPLEGMVELQRFFTDHESGQTISWDQTRFGQQLLEAGLSADQVQALADNPTLDTDDGPVSAFDLTEEKNASESVSLLT